MGRNPSSTSKTIDDCVLQMPQLPQQSSQLASMLLSPGIREPINLGTVDADTCNALRPEQCEEKASFLSQIPPKLALMKRCADSKVMVAPSEIVANATGLYTTSDIAAGTVMFRAESTSGRWVGLDEFQEAGANAVNSLKVEVVTPYRQPKQMFLVGDASRFPWPHLNSTWGTGREANLKWDFVEGDMGDSFVVFTTTKDIPAFSNELLLDYRVRFDDDIAPGRHSRREEQGAEAAEQGAQAAEQAAERGAEAALFGEDDAIDAWLKASPSHDTLPVEDRSHVRLRDYARAGALMEPDMVTYIAALLRTPHTQREREREIESTAHAQQGTGTENTAQSRHRTRIVFTHTSASLDNSHTHTYCTVCATHSGRATAQTHTVSQH